MPIESGAIAPAPSQYPAQEVTLQEEPPCASTEPCQRPSSLRDLAYALQKHPAGNTVLEQIAQVCGATPGNIEILQEIEHYLSRPPWEMPGSLLGGGAVVGTGNVTGPTSSTDNAIARYDGTTGTEIQNSPIIIDDSGNMTGVVDLTVSGAISANSASLTNPLPHTSGGTGLNTDPSDGQLLVGNSSLGGYSLADLGAGTGILITIGPGSISIEAENNGDVVGPLSATDNAIARYDGATGKLIQDSGVLVDDSANVTGAGSILLTEQASAPLPVASGEGMFWSKADTPTSPYFTDDIGDDHELMAGNNNLSEITNAATARSNLGLGSLATKSSVATSDIDNNAVTDAKLRQGAGQSVIGRAASSAGDVADITGSNNQVLRVGALGTLAFGQVNLGSSAAVTGSLPIANGGTGASSADAAVQNLTNGATSRTPVLTDEIPFNDVGTGGGKTTPQAVYNLINSLTAETSPVYNDKVALYDASASQTDAVTIADLFGVGRIAVIAYTGSGVSGKTVTLTGINRAYAIEIWRNDTGANTQQRLVPNGATGTVMDRNFTNAATHSDKSLSAPAAGTAQVLTINATYGEANQSGIPYILVVLGTPT